MNILRSLVSDRALAAAAATLVASCIGLLAIVAVALINARAGRTLAQQNARRDYRLKQADRLTEFVDRRVREFLQLRARRSTDLNFDAHAEAVTLTANDHEIASTLAATGEAVGLAFLSFIDTVRAFENTLRVCQDREDDSRGLIRDAEQCLTYGASLVRIAAEAWVFPGSWFQRYRAKRRLRRMRAEIGSKLRELDKQLWAKEQRSRNSESTKRLN
jgi:hypothetical protein